MIGDPIEQTKSPMLFNQHCAKADRKSVMVPMRIEEDNLENFINTLRSTRMIEGIVSTIPHKTVLAGLVDHLQPTASRLGVVNAAKFSADGALVGDMFDGTGFLNALEKNRFDPSDASVLIVGGGAAGSAIAIALQTAGSSTVDIYEPRTQQREHLKLAMSGLTGVTINQLPVSPAGYDLVINASPLGMQKGDIIPIKTSELDRTTFVADVVTSPTITPMLKHAMDKGCRVQTGEEMAAGHLEAILSFFDLRT